MDVRYGSVLGKAVQGSKGEVSCLPMASIHVPCTLYLCRLAELTSFDGLAECSAHPLLPKLEMDSMEVARDLLRQASQPYESGLAFYPLYTAVLCDSF